MSLRQPRPGASQTGTPRGNQPTRATLDQPPALRETAERRAPAPPPAAGGIQIVQVRSRAEDARRTGRQASALPCSHPPAGVPARARGAVHTRTGRHRPGRGPTRPPEAPAAGAKMPPSSTPAPRQQRRPPRRPRSRTRPRRGSAHASAGRTAQPGPAPSGPRKHCGQPPPGARRQNRSGTGGPKGLQRRPSTNAVPRPDK
ncbi:hypothetical protein NDU88_003937 [Pleurodeles waltl]|uniref:Uncharacterized protein n=1 Tax=Pleurodeles waltl TaxID=8319 RepID=A0AAV7RI14_PLEWA|nr:hypothetical protein NDU88_003937 [Pleurodeles waltl]